MDFSELKGKILKSIEISENERIIFVQDDETNYSSYHMYDCCESVKIKNIIGSLTNIIGSPIIEAIETQEEQGNPPPDNKYSYSWTWTKQYIRTELGEVIFIWLGESNGCYSEVPHFGLIHKPIKGN